MKLRGKTILITGGSSGIGLSLAKQLAKNNVVIICGRSQLKLDASKQIIPNINIVQCDIGRDHDRIQLFKYLLMHHPECDVLINNAAIVHRTDFKTDDDVIAKAEAELAINLLAPIALSKMFLSMTNPKAIINITSGLVYAPRAIYPFYNSTKAGLHSFSQVLRHQLANSGIKIIEVMMPVVNTPWHQGNVPKIAISADVAAKEMILQLENGKSEVKVGAVKLLSTISRLAPKLAFALINRIK